MLDTDICSYIMRDRPASVLQALQERMANRHRVVVSAITYAELRFGAVGKKAPSNANIVVDGFMARINEVLPWDKAAADAATRIRKALGGKGQPIGYNDTLIAGHAIARGCILVTNNTKEFQRIEKLRLENWVAATS